MNIRIRPAAGADARAMTELLNAIVAEGGTSAITESISAEYLSEWMDSADDASAWHVAEGAAGEILGFQWIGPHRVLPPEACDIATFVRIGRTQLGIGSKLFAATERASRDLGYGWINGEIRADNKGGITYYQSRGFRRWGSREGVTLGDGQIVDKVLMRYDLD